MGIARPSRSRALLIAGLAVSATASLPVTAQPPIDLSLLGTTHPGFRITGIDLEDLSGTSVSGAGDVNGDGLADLVVGAPHGDPGDVYNAGESYVVFGKADGTAVDLSVLGTTHPGFRIDGVEDFGGFAGFSVSGAGDVNGDGLADLVVGAFGVDRTVGPYSAVYQESGESYVVFGKADGTPVDLLLLGTAHPGFRINGIDTFDLSGSSVSGAGDVNGDGLADLIIGADWADGGGLNRSGESYVVFGKADGTPVDLSQIGTTHPGFRIVGIDADDSSGYSVSGAGDVNGDGLADLIVGAKNAEPGGVGHAGESYVVFGKVDGAPVDLLLIGTTHPGFRIDGIDAADNSGRSVSGAGDVNGDGLADLVVGARHADPGDIHQAGESYVVFGKADGTPVDLSLLGTTHPGFRIDGIAMNDLSGFSVSGAGDVNDDGLADLIVSAHWADPGGDSLAGECYVVFSPMAAPATSTYKSVRGVGAAHLSPVGVSGDGSNESTPDSRAWVGFADGDAASMQTVTIHRNQSLGSTSSPTVWEVSTDRTGWTSASLKFKYTEAEVTGLTEADLVLYKADSIGGPYAPLTTTVDAAKNTVSADVSSFSFFAIGTDTGLPVEVDGFAVE